MYVCTYVHTWWSHLGMSIGAMLRNVNLLSHLECQFALMLIIQASLKRVLHKEVDKEWSGKQRGQHGWALQRMYLAESNTETSAECSRRLVTLRKKSKEVVHRRSQESKRERVHKYIESMYRRVFTSQVFVLLAPTIKPPVPIF